MECGAEIESISRVQRPVTTTAKGTTQPQSMRVQAGYMFQGRTVGVVGCERPSLTNLAQAKRPKTLVSRTGNSQKCSRSLASRCRLKWWDSISFVHTVEWHSLHQEARFPFCNPYHWPHPSACSASVSRMRKERPV